MKSNGNLTNILGIISKSCTGLAGLTAIFFIGMAMIAAIGLLPDRMAATFEIPIHLHNPSVFYEVASVNPALSVSHIEVKDAELEVLPEDHTWPQSLAYFLGAIYVGLLAMIFLKLSNLLDSFSTNHPFSRKNVAHIRWIGLCVIGLGLYPFFMNFLLEIIFQYQFTSAHATVASIEAIQNINFLAVFAGLVMIVFANVFNTGAALQELEELTV